MPEGRRAGGWRGAQVLQKESQSLSSLLEVMCGVAVNKSFQLSDWRQR